MAGPLRRIAVVCRWADGYGGTTRGMTERARRFSADGWEVHVYAERLDQERFKDTGAILHPTAGLPWGGPWKRRFFSWRAEHLLYREPFDLVEGHGDTLSQDVLMLHNCVHAAHEAIHGDPLPDGDELGRLHRRMIEGRAFKLLVANSELMKRDVVARFGVPAEKAVVAHPGHDPLQFSLHDKESLRGPTRARLGVGADGVLVGMTTSGDFKKRGIDLFVSTLARLPPDLRGSVHGLIVGKERHLEPYRRQAAEAGLGERIHFLPPIREVQRYLHALDVFLYPALYEEFGQSVQEAFACGVPVLTSRRVGAGELLGARAEEMLLPRPDPELFAPRLAELARDAAMRRRWAENGVAACRDNTWDAHSRRVRDLYKGLLGRDF